MRDIYGPLAAEEQSFFPVASHSLGKCKPSLVPRFWLLPLSALKISN